MNFADNGRHLADQDYTICMRQEEGEETVITGRIEVEMGE